MRRGSVEVARLVKEQRESGQSVVAFCRSRGLQAKTFYRWREGGVAAEPGRFALVKSERRIELELGSGVTVRVASEDLGAVLEALR